MELTGLKVKDMIWETRPIKLVVKSMKVENQANYPSERIQYRKSRKLGPMMIGAQVNLFKTILQ